MLPLGTATKGGKTIATLFLSVTLPLALAATAAGQERSDTIGGAGAIASPGFVNIMGAGDESGSSGGNPPAGPPSGNPGPQPTIQAGRGIIVTESGDNIEISVDWQTVLTTFPDYYLDGSSPRTPPVMQIFGGPKRFNNSIQVSSDQPTIMLRSRNQGPPFHMPAQTHVVQMDVQVGMTDAGYFAVTGRPASSTAPWYTPIYIDMVDRELSFYGTAAFEDIRFTGTLSNRDTGELDVPHLVSPFVQGEYVRSGFVEADYLQSAGAYLTDQVILERAGQPNGSMEPHLSVMAPQGSTNLEVALALYQANRHATFLRARNNGLHFTDWNHSVRRTIFVQSVNTSSDARLKDDITGLTEDRARDLVMALRPVSYHLKGEDRLSFGLIAQEVLEIAPDLVFGTEDEDEMLSIDYQQLVAPMLAVIQGLERELAAERARVSDLEAIVARIEDRLDGIAPVMPVPAALIP